jgi:hypothetical protein
MKPTLALPAYRARDDRLPRPDRRRRPTPFPIVGLLLTPGRRCRFRRLGEGANRYVDRISAPLVWWVVTVLLLSAIDAWFTLVHIHNGGEELVPTMAWALERGPEVFTGLKLAMTGVGTLILASHEHFRLSRVSVPLVSLAYATLTAYHVCLVWFA